MQGFIIAGPHSDYSTVHNFNNINNNYIYIYIYIYTSYYIYMYILCTVHVYKTHNYIFLTLQ